MAEFLPVDGQSHEDLMEAALLSSFADDNPESKSVIVLIQEKTISTTDPLLDLLAETNQ